MKQNRRATSRGISSRLTTPRRARRDAQEDLAAQAQNAPQHGAAASKDPLGATVEFYTPMSLKSGAGRQYWDEVLRLLVSIRADCDAAAEQLGYTSDKDDGLAAVEHIANKILEAVRGERQQQITSGKKPGTKTQSVPRAPDLPQQTATEAKYQSVKPAQPAQPAAHSERAKLIGELKQMLRDGRTKAGAVIDPQLTHEIAKHITTLNEEMPETPQSIKRIREGLARLFGKVSEDRKTPKKPAKAAAAAQSRRPAKPEPSRPKKPKTIVTKRSVAKRSVSKGAKGAKKRPR